MSFLPDFGLSCNGNRNPKRCNLPISEKFREIHSKLIQEDVGGMEFEEKIGANSIRRRHKPTDISSQACRNLSVEDELQKLISDIFVQLGTDIPHPQRRLLLMKAVVRHWSSNQEHYRTMKPSDYISIVYRQVLLFGSQCVWKSKKYLANEFVQKSLPQRRVELILSGVDRPTAEKFLTWQANVVSWFAFPELDIRIFQTNVAWSDIGDQHLIKFVCSQNGLARNLDFTDWYVEAESEELKKFHPEELRHRYKSRFYKNIHNISKHVPSEEIEDQFEKYNLSVRIDKKFVAFGTDWTSLCNFMKQCEFNGRSFKSWIALSSSIGMETSTILIRKMVRQYLTCLNPFKEKALVNASGNDDKWCALFEKDHRALRSLIEATANELLCEPEQWDHKSQHIAKFPNGEELCITQVCKDSILRILHLFTKSKAKSALVGIDIIIFEVAKSWEKKLLQQNQGNPFLRIEQILEGDKSKKGLSEADIIHLLQLDETESIREDWNIVIENNPEEMHSSYSKKFCFRKLSDVEWKLIIRAAYLAGCLTEVDFNKNDTWHDIVAASGVCTGKKSEDIRAQFMEAIFPKLDQYCGEEIRSSLHQMIKPP